MKNVTLKKSILKHTQTVTIEVKKQRKRRPMANGVDHYDENENGGDVETSPLPSCVSWQQIGLPSHLL